MQIDQTDTIDADARRAVTDVLEAFNDAATGRPEPSRPLAVLVRDGVGSVQGGAWAVSYYDWLFVNLLYLPESLRRHGWGSRIMRALEREAVRRGCIGIWLDTLTFQAPAFYPRFGFNEFAALENYASGHRRIWFHKTNLSGGPIDADLDVDSDPDTADRDTILTGLNAFNDEADGPGGQRPLALLLRAAPGEKVTGGLLGRSSRGWLFIELLGIPEAARRQGIGTRLMAMAEAEARARGCRGIWLDTFSWQAQPFYERLGFQAIGTLPHFPGRHTRTWLSKRLDQDGAAR